MTKKRVKKKMWHNANLSLNVAFFRNDPHATSTAGWRLITFPCGMPACVTPRETSHSPKGSLVLLYINVFFWHMAFFFSYGRGSFLVLSAPWHSWSPPEHHGASVGPGRRPWHVLWGFKVATPHGEAFRARRAIQALASSRTG